MEYFTPQTLEFYGKISFLKAGIVFSDAVTTVSKNIGRRYRHLNMGAALRVCLKKGQRKSMGSSMGLIMMSGTLPRII